MILIRHAESQANVGNTDVENCLTEKGISQAKELAKRLLDDRFDQIFCSPAKRCVQTLDELIKGHGEAMGISLSRLLSPKKKGEQYEELQKRIRRFVEDLKVEFENETVVVVSHQLVIGMFLYELTGKTELLANGEVKTAEVQSDKSLN